jgi:hypothetical protein
MNAGSRLGSYEIVPPLGAGTMGRGLQSPAFHNYGDVFGRRGARIARREEGACRAHVTDEQRSEAGCIGGRDVIVIVKRRTKCAIRD